MPQARAFRAPSRSRLFWSVALTAPASVRSAGTCSKSSSRPNTEGNRTRSHWPSEDPNWRIELSVLERYRTDPRYLYRHDDISGMIRTARPEDRVTLESHS
jgi:hypothetical protein